MMAHFGRIKRNANTKEALKEKNELKSFFSRKILFREYEGIDENILQPTEPLSSSQIEETIKK